MSDFFGELAKKLAERWVSLLAVPGLIFICAVLTGFHLRWAHALDADYALSALDTAVSAGGDWPASHQALAVAGVLLGAAVVGVAAGGLASVVQAVWLGRWPTPLGAVVARQLVRIRRDRWDTLVAERFALEETHPADGRTAEVQLTVDDLAAQAAGIALARPASPTWIGDRFKAVESIAYHRYKLDLTYVWPAFWLAVPDLVRSEVTAAGGRFADATVRGAWAALYSALAVLWPPAWAIALVLGFAAWRRGRAAAAAQTQLLEAAIDLHGRKLADAFGMTARERTGPLSEDEGAEITRICRKGR